MALKFPNNKFSFGGQLGGTVVLVALLVVSLVTVVLYSREGDEGMLHGLQNTTSAVTSPLSAIGVTTGSLAASATTSVEDLTASDASLSQLRENNAQLAQMVVELESYRQEAQRLEAQLGLADAYGFSYVASRVVGYSADSYNRVLTIDVGSNAGVKAGLPVMGTTGVVGQVISTTPLTSQVRLINDAQSGVSVMLQSSHAEGILTGSVDGILYLENVDESVEVKEGEAVITSGLGGGYFRGLVVGTVSRIETNQSDGTRTIVITPNATLTNISEVLVVIGMNSDGAANENGDTASALINSVNPDTLNAAGSNQSGQNQGSQQNDQESQQNDDNNSSGDNSSDGSSGNNG